MIHIGSLIFIIMDYILLSLDNIFYFRVISKSILKDTVFIEFVLAATGRMWHKLNYQNQLKMRLNTCQKTKML